MYQFFLPESMYQLDSEMNLAKLLWYHETGSTLTGKVIRIHNNTKRLDVDLGNGIIAKMPFEEATIYPIYKANYVLSPDVYTLVGKLVQVKIIKIKNLHRIYVSRKENMKEVLTNIKNKTFFDFVEITAYSEISTFIDVGGGIKGKIEPFYFSPVRFNHVRDVEIPTGTTIPVSVLHFNEENMTFDLSRILPATENVLYPGKVVIAKIFDPLGDGIGYFCLVKNSICGILDSPKFELQYGDTVVAKVKRITEKGPKLSFLRKFNF